MPPDPREQARSTSLLTEITNEAPAATGLRGALNQFGLHLGPTERERAERADAAAVSQHWAGPRTIAVVNGKGGATKTPTAILLSAIFARYGGAGVIAYDNNSTRGTLGWRTQQGPHDATVIDLLPHVGHLLSPQAQAAEISGFVHHQREDRYDVLRSRPEVLADAKPGDADSVDAIHSVLTKYYRLVVIDSGNDESSPQWRAMIARADAIVVPTTTRPDHAESARLLLAELAGANAHAARLAENALVVVSQGSKGEPEPSQLVSTFQGIARAAVGIPYDPAMAGRPLILDSLAPPAAPGSGRVPHSPWGSPSSRPGPAGGRATARTSPEPSRVIGPSAGGTGTPDMWREASRGAPQQQLRSHCPQGSTLRLARRESLALACEDTLTYSLRPLDPRSPVEEPPCPYPITVARTPTHAHPIRSRCPTPASPSAWPMPPAPWRTPSRRPP